ncbi:MAG: hypothetical protein ACI9GM_001433 [Salibacteraceae bacterium]|jgi:hypothetical protein
MHFYEINYGLLSWKIRVKLAKLVFSKLTDYDSRTIREKFSRSY